jgi:chromate transporter
MKDYIDLLWTFCKMGAVTFGGGYALLPIIQRELVDRRNWVTLEEILDYFAIGQCTPGIIAVNVSTFVGYKRKGAGGAVAATLGFVLPSLVIISIIAGLLTAFSENPWTQRAFAGIRVAVGALIADAVVTLYKGAVKNVTGLVICVIAFLLSAVFRSSPVLIILAAGIAGFFLFKPRAEVQA